MRSIAINKVVSALFFFNVVQKKFFMSDGTSNHCCGPLNDNSVFAMSLDTLGKNNLVVFACLVVYLCKSSTLVKLIWAYSHPGPLSQYLILSKLFLSLQYI